MNWRIKRAWRRFELADLYVSVRDKFPYWSDDWVYWASQASVAEREGLRLLAEACGI